MTQKVKPASAVGTLGNHEERIRALERSRPDTAGNFGVPTQIIPLPNIVANNGNDTVGFGWVNDATYPGGGYLGCDNINGYFTFLALLHPKGSIWGLRGRFGGGPDHARFKIQASSLEYEYQWRPSGDPSGKIEPASQGGYSYVNLVTAVDTYQAAPTVDVGVINGSYQFIVGGDLGDELTDFTTGELDPMTAVELMDGGPGWYKFKIAVDGRNGSNTTGYKLRLTSLAMMRLDDDAFA